MSLIDAVRKIAPKPNLPHVSLPKIDLPDLPKVPTGWIPGAGRKAPPPRRPMSPEESQAYVQGLAKKGRISEREAVVPTAATTGNTMSVHTDRAAWRSILGDLKKAKSSIHINEYQAVEGKMTKELADVLCDKARAGVDVRCVIERASVTKTAKADFDRMRAAGVEIVTNDTLNPRDQDGPEGKRRGGFIGSLPGPLRRAGEFVEGAVGTATSDEFAHPDHRKVWVIDGKVGYTGGLGINDDFRDKTHDVMVRLEGPVVNQMQAEFLGTYKWRGGNLPSDVSPLFPNPTVREDGMKMTSLTNIPGPEAHPITREYGRQIDGAKRSLDVMNPYIGEDDLTDKLIAAAKRGVKVRVFVPEHPEHVLARGEQYNSYEKLLKAGVEVREFLPSQLHPKVMVADGERVLVGSANLDGASMHRNLEHDVLVDDRRAAAQFQRQLFGPDTRGSRRVTLDDAGRHGDSLKEKVRNRAADVVTDLLSRF